MNTDILQMISIVAFSLAAVFLLIAIVLFFKLDVRAIIDDLSGKKAERQIQELREQNRSPEMSRNGRVLYNVSSEEKTAKLPAKITRPLGEDAKEEETTLLEEETMLLAEEGTTLLAEDTTLLAEEGTTLLDMTGILLQNGYRLLADVMIVHIEECI